MARLHRRRGSRERPAKNAGSGVRRECGSICQEAALAQEGVGVICQVDVGAFRDRCHGECTCDLGRAAVATAQDVNGSVNGLWMCDYAPGFPEGGNYLVPIRPCDNEKFINHAAAEPCAGPPTAFAYE